MSSKTSIPQPVPLNHRGIPLPAGKISYEDFLEWLDEDTHAEWVDGEVLMPSPASYRHQNIKGFLEVVLRTFVETFELGVVLSAGFQMRLPGSGREPDLLFVSRLRQGQFQRTFLNGPADLAVEIISPESIERDRQDKFIEYAAGGVGEYWLIDPEQSQAEFYRLAANGQYQLVPPDAAGHYHSDAVPGFWLAVAWLWQEPLPATRKILLQVGGEAYARRLLEDLQEEGFLPPTA